MRTEYLKYLLEIEKYGSINKAAENLFISRTTLLYALNALEKELGYTIFDRTMHGVITTPAGQKLLQEAYLVAPIIAGWYQIKPEAIQPQRTITLVISSIVRKYVLYDTQLQMHKSFPNIILKYLEGDQYDPANITKFLQKHEPLLMVTAVASADTAELIHVLPTLHYQVIPVFSNVFRLYFSKKHPLSKQTIIKRQDLLQLPLWGYPQFADRLLRNDAILHNSTNKLVLQKGLVSAESTWKAIVENEYALLATGIAEIPIKDVEQAVCIKTIDDLDATMDYFVICPEDVLLQREERFLIQFLIDQLNDLTFL